jgi:hypothetical protein
LEEEYMNSKQQGQGAGKGEGVAKEKTISVDDDSQQAQAPGAVSPERGNQQSAREADGVGERGGVGAQQTGWSARQSVERLRARREEERLGQSRQSGYGGAEQSQRAGAQESPTGPARAQSGTNQGQHSGAEPLSDYGGSASNRRGRDA